jgi:hypothetical protein
MKTIAINGKVFCRIETTIKEIERCFPMAKKVIEVKEDFINIVI